MKNARLNLHPEAAGNALRAALPAALNAAGETLLAHSQTRCPVRSGRLRASGRIAQENNRVCVGYDAPYAVTVHERGAKFLEAPLNETAVQQEILSALAREIQF